MRGEDSGDGEGADEAGLEPKCGTCVGMYLVETDVLVEKRKMALRPRTSNAGYFQIRLEALGREYREQGDWLSSDHTLDTELRLLSLMVIARC
jgi:hypothetical protein